MSDREEKDASTMPNKVPTGLPGLEAILQGGFYRGGVYMLLARPGSGKTILGNQIAFRHVADGGRALYVTLLAESHSRMLSAMEPMAFFDKSSVGRGLSYLSGYEALENGRLKGLLELLRKVVRDHKATLLVLDGLVTVGAVAESELETKKFIHELQVFVELVGCTTLLLTGGSPDEQYALRTMVDGLLELKAEAVGMETVRSLEVTKFRGGANLLGRHLFEITDAGISIHPRTESRRGLALTEPDPARTSVATIGIKNLDKMLGGGLRSDSLTLVLGAPGSGKTLLGLSFLAAGARAREPGLYFGFFESPGVLCRKADAIGLRLSDHVKSGLVEVTWQSPRAEFADALAEKVLTAVRERGVRRLFIDGLDGFRDALVYPERIRRFFGALCDELRAMGVVTMLSDQSESLGEIELPEHGLTAMLDNVIALRHAELGERVRKLISIVKMREGEGDSSLHEFMIAPSGIVVSPLSGRGEALRVAPHADPSSRARPQRSTAKKAGKKRGR